MCRRFHQKCCVQLLLPEVLIRMLCAPQAYVVCLVVHCGDLCRLWEQEDSAQSNEAVLARLPLLRILLVLLLSVTVHSPS